MSKELSSIGINWIFAPVLDVLTELTEPSDTSRRFSDEVGLVNNHAKALTQGINSHGIASCATEILSSTVHGIYNLIDNDGPREEFMKTLEQTELELLKHLLRQQCLDSLRISSVVHEFPDLSKLGQSIHIAVRDVLRERLDCQSPITLDCSALPPDSDACIKHAPLRALLAGCDMVRLPNDSITQVASISAIYVASASSALEESVVSAAASRVSKLKDSYTSWHSALTVRGDFAAHLIENANIAQLAYQASITALAAEPSPLLGFPSTSILLLLTPKVYSAANPEISTSDPFEPLGRALSRSHSRTRHVPYTVSAGLTSTHMAFLNRATIIVLVLCNSSSAFTEAQEEFVNGVRSVVQEHSSTTGTDIKKVVIGAGDPRDLRGDWGGWWRVCCYDYTSRALEAAAEVVVGHRVATGRLPITLH